MEGNQESKQSPRADGKIKAVGRTHSLLLLTFAPHAHSRQKP